MTVSFKSEYQGYNSFNNYRVVKHEEPKGGGFAAIMGGTAVTAAATPLTLGIMNRMDKVHNYTESEIELIKKSAQEILKKRGLIEKGVQIKYLPESTEAFTFMDFANPINMIKKGKNAGFLDKDIEGFNLFGEKVVIEKSNTILMPEKKLQGSVFHEIGHADTFNNGKILKALQKMRVLSLALPGIILLYGACSRKSKVKNGQTELTSGQKTNNFIRDNAGKLAFASMLPILIEEAAATIKGHKFAKELVSKDIAKKALRGNMLGFASYFVTAVMSGLAAMAAVKIKDKKIAEKEAKIQARLNINA